MTIITEADNTKHYFKQVLDAFPDKPNYTMKKVQWRNTMTRETLDNMADSIEDDCIIFIGSKLLRAYTGLTPMQWDLQPARKDSRTVYCVPNLGYVIRKSADLTRFAKVISAGMFIDDSDGAQPYISEEIPIQSVLELEKCLDHCRETGLACFDFETFCDSDEHKDYEWFREDFHASLLAISPQPGIGYTLPMNHKESPFMPQEQSKVLQILEDGLFNNQHIRKIGWNTKYDMNVANRIGIKKLDGRYDDGMLMLSILENNRKTYRLKDVAGEVFPETLGYEDEVNNYQWKDVPLDVLGRYAANDSSITMLLCSMFEERMDDRLMTLYRNLVAPAMKTLQKMEFRGMHIDLDVIEEGIKYAEELDEQINNDLIKLPQVVKFQKIKNKEIIENAINVEEAKIAKWESDERKTDHYVTRSKEKIRAIKTGEIVVTKPINLYSPKQLGELLYRQDGFAFKSLKRTTAEDVLSDISDDTGFIEKLLLGRKVRKTKATYLESIKDKTVNGKLHTTFTQHVTATGRLSSRSPNLQNLPNIYRLKDEELIKLVGYVKAAFVAPEGYHIAQFDLSQAELRFMAEFSKDETMVKAYKEGKDLHAIAAAANQHISLDEFYKQDETKQKDHRFRAKARNFGLIYLMSPQGYRAYAKSNYGIILSDPEAYAEHERFFILYPGVRKYHKIYEAKAKKYGKVRNWFGRQYWMPDINLADDFKAGMNIRASINYPIQGSSGDYMTLSLVQMDQRLGDDILLINSIHDSAIAYVKSDKLKQDIPMVVECMENPMAQELFNRKWDNLVMKVDVELSDKNWVEMKEINVKELG